MVFEWVVIGLSSEVQVLDLRRKTPPREFSWLFEVHIMYSSRSLPKIHDVACGLAYRAFFITIPLSSINGLQVHSHAIIHGDLTSVRTTEVPSQPCFVSLILVRNRLTS